MTVKNTDIVAANLGQPQSPTNPQLQVKLVGCVVQQKNADAPRPMHTTDGTELTFSCDGVPLDFFQAAILQELKSSASGSAGYVQGEVTTHLKEHGLIEVGGYPSRDGKLCVVSLTDRSRHNDIISTNSVL